MFRKILLAADGSEHSLRAAEKAVELAKLRKFPLFEILFVADNAHAKQDVLNSWNSQGLELERRKQIQTITEIASAHGVDFEIKILRGDPASVIAKYANEQGFDLVVMGSRGLSGVQEFFLGSVSHKVAKWTKSSVFIVR